MRQNPGSIRFDEVGRGVRIGVVISVSQAEVFRVSASRDNKGQALTAVVERVLPDYRERRRWLKENESLLTGSALNFHT